MSGFTRIEKAGIPATDVSDDFKARLQAIIQGQGQPQQVNAPSGNESKRVASLEAEVKSLEQKVAAYAAQNATLLQEKKQMRQQWEELKKVQEATNAKISSLIVGDTVVSGEPVIQELKQRQAAILKEQDKLMQLDATRLAEACKALEKKVDDPNILKLVTEMNSYRIALDGIREVFGATEEYQKEFLNKKIMDLYWERKEQNYRTWINLLRQALRTSRVDTARVDELMLALNKANREALIARADLLKVRHEKEVEFEKLTAMLGSLYDEAGMMEYSSRNKLPEIAPVGRSFKQIEEKLTEKKALEARLKQYRARMEIAEREAWGYKALNAKLAQHVEAHKAEFVRLEQQLKLEIGRAHV